MKHAYMIMAYKNWNQLCSLLQSLDDYRNDIYLHIDLKSNFNSSILDGIVGEANIFLIPRINVSWGGFSQIKCEISLLNEALKKKYDYYHLLSGADMPLHGIDYIDSFFKSNSGKEFIHLSSVAPCSLHPDRDRICFYHFFQENLGRYSRFLDVPLCKLQNLFSINRLHDQTFLLAKGAQWFSITDSFARYVINVLPYWVPFFKMSFCADELFLQTIVVNSPFYEKLYRSEPDDNIESNMRLVDWKRGRPYTFRIDDFQQLNESKMLFARKFDEDVDSKIIDSLKNKIKNNDEY